MTRPASPKQRQSAPTHIIFTALKWKRKDAESVTLLHAAGGAAAAMLS